MYSLDVKLRKDGRLATDAQRLVSAIRETRRSAPRGRLQMMVELVDD